MAGAAPLPLPDDDEPIAAPPDPAPVPGAPPPAPAGPTLLRGPDGEVYKFADPTKAIAAGYRPLSPHELIVHQVEKEERAKGTVGSLEAAGSSALNQLLFGLPGAVTEETETPEEKERREASEEYHQTARFLGGAVGVGGSLLAGGEFFKLSDLAGQAVSRGILPQAERAAAGLGVKLAAKGAELATQGAVLASPQALVQASFGDPQKAAETLLWGIGAGAVLGGGSELLAAAGQGALERVGEKLGEGGVQGALEKFASDRTAKAIGAERSQLNKLAPERVRELTDFAHEEGLIRPGMSRADVGAAIDAAHAKYGAQIGDTLGKLDTLITKGTASEDLVSKGIRPGEIGDAIMQALDTPEMRMPMNADQRAALDTVVKSAHLIPSTQVNGREVVSFDDAQKFVSSLRRKWVASISKDLNDGGLRGIETVTPLDQMKSAAYRVARDAVHAAGDRVALAADEPALVGELARAKTSYAKLAELDKWAATVEKQAAGNRAIGLTDWISMGQGPAAHVGMGLGAAIGGFAGGLPGAAVGGSAGKIAGGLLDFLGKKWGEDKGLVLLSALAKRAAKEGPEVFSAVLAAESQKRLAATMSDVQGAVRRLAVSGLQRVRAPDHPHMATLLGTTSGLTSDQAYDKLGRHLTALAASPDALAQSAAAVTAPLATTAPEVALATQQKIAQAVTYLHQALPKPDGPAAPFAPQTWSPAPADKLAFHDRAEIVANPMAAMRHVEQGTLSPAHVEALAAVYPTVYAMMKQEILEFHAKHPDVLLPIAERQSIATFLGTPLGTMDAHVGALQQGYAGAPASGGPGGGGGAPKKVARAGAFQGRPSQATTFGQTQGPREET